MCVVSCGFFGVLYRTPFIYAELCLHDPQKRKTSKTLITLHQRSLFTLSGGASAATLGASSTTTRRRSLRSPPVRLVALGEKVRDTVVLVLEDWDCVTAPDCVPEESREGVPEEDREGEEVELKEATLLVTEAVGQVEGEAVGEMLCELDSVPAPLLGVAEGDSVGVVVELKDRLPVGDDVEENEIRGVTLVEGLRERLPDCEALRVTVGELVMDLDLRAEKEFVGLVESDLDTAPEAV